MAKTADRPTLKITDDEGWFVHAAWSRSGKRAILSIGRTWDDAAQVELRPEEAQQLAVLLNSGPDRQAEQD